MTQSSNTLRKMAMSVVTVVVVGTAALVVHAGGVGDTREVRTNVAPASVVTQVQEDSRGWDCRTRGNHICGPGGRIQAGCYEHGRLVIPWVRFDVPREDFLWGRGYTSAGRYATCTELLASA